MITPHDGSEPLLVSWDEARRLAEDYGVRLALTTNTQFLDENAFHQAKHIVETIVMSVDSHVPEIYEPIRVGSDPPGCSRMSRPPLACATSTASRRSCRRSS